VFIRNYTEIRVDLECWSRVIIVGLVELNEKADLSAIRDFPILF